MKVTDLMLNDLVLVKVFSQIPTYEIRRVDLDLLSRFDRLQVEPIKLTPEIMEANGFVDIDGDGDLWQNEQYKCGVDNQHRTMEFYTYNNQDDYDLENQIRHCYRVHTLQHAMRLCGLSKLADNFKLTKGE